MQATGRKDCVKKSHNDAQESEGVNVKSVGIAIAMIIVIALCAGALMVWGALVYAAGVSWIGGGNFSDGWAQAFGKPLVLFLWAFLFFSLVPLLRVKR